jgi:hypothetical protein
MKLRARIEESAGEFRAECLEEVAPCSARGRSREEALEKLAAEVRFYMEKCPCSWLPDDAIQFET